MQRAQNRAQAAAGSTTDPVPSTDGAAPSPSSRFTAVASVSALASTPASSDVVAAPSVASAFTRAAAAPSASCCTRAAAVPSASCFTAAPSSRTTSWRRLRSASRKILGCSRPPRHPHSRLVSRRTARSLTPASSLWAAASTAARATSRAGGRARIKSRAASRPSVA